MLSTMQDYPLTVRAIFEHGERVYADRRVSTFDGTTIQQTSFAQVAQRARRLAAALVRLGVKPGDRVGTFCWNCQEHLEAYFAVPCIGAVLHTLNLRLFPEQIAYVINHAEDSVIIVDESLVSLLAPILPKLPTVRHLIVVARSQESGVRVQGSGGTQHSALGTHDYETLLSGEKNDFAFGDIDERSAAAMCYTSGTTGNPKGVVYSHRSICLHSMAVISPSSFGLSPLDQSLVIPSMFHANAWGIPHAGWWVGSDLIFPGRYVQAEPLSRLIAMTRPTFAGAVPTIWNDLTRHVEQHGADLSSLRLCISGGSAVPRSLIERMQKLGVRLVQIWGMTETGPLAALSHPPVPCEPGSEADMAWRTKTGRILHGIDLRIVEGETILPWDGAAIGEIEIRGPWVTGSYYKDSAPEKFHDGWLRTGDVGTVDPLGYIQITDRAKDVVKSGGEWISSIEIENLAVAHPAVLEAAVIAARHPRWQERPLLLVQCKPGERVTRDELLAFLDGKIAKWWMPDDVVVVDSFAHTATGKILKTVLRDEYGGWLERAS